MYNGDLVKLRAYKEEDIERAVQFINDEEVKKLLDSNVPFPMAKWQEEDWVRGYGSDALKVLNKFIFEEVNMNKIKLSAFSFNHRAIACYKKVGFQEEGRLKKEIYRNGKYHDEIVMAIFKEDFKA